LIFEYDWTNVVSFFRRERKLRAILFVLIGQRMGDAMRRDARRRRLRVARRRHRSSSSSVAEVTCLVSA